MPSNARMTTAEWSARIVEPVNARAALEQIQSAIDYAESAIDTVMSMYSGTMPPARALLPDLYSALDNAKRARDGVAEIAERTPEATLAPMYVIAGRNLGSKLIDEANSAMDKSAKSESPAAVAAQAAPKIMAKLADLPGPVLFAGLLGLIAWDLSRAKR